MRVAALIWVSVVLSASACAADGVRIVDGAPVDDDGWPVRPADETFRCPEGTDLVDERTATGRRTVTCKSIGNPLPRGFQLTWNEERALVSQFEFSDSGVPRSRKRWFDDGEVAAEEEYDEGRLIRRTAWYVNGRKKLEMFFDADKGLLRVKRFQPDGSPESAGQTRDGVKVGEWTEWRDGAMATLTYVDGVPHGKVVRTYPAGGVERGQYEAGKKHGEWVRTDDRGNPVREMHYSHGQKTGRYRLFHPNTQLREEGQFVNGRRHREWKTWHPSGELESDAWYSCGTPVGPYRAFFPDGDLRKKGTYEDGKPVGEWQTYNDAGIVTRIEQFDAPSATFDPAELPDECPPPDA